jgi:hypothetical protein
MKVLTTGFALVLIATAASAQTSRPVDADTLKSRQKISTMERVLEGAVANGAENLFRQVRARMPVNDGPRLSGAPQVRGFRLDGFGVFFDVEVPDLLMPPSWSLRYMLDQNGLTAAAAVEEFKAALPLVRDARQRMRLEQAIGRIELQVGPVQPRNVSSPRSSVAAATTVGSQSAEAAAPPVAPVDPGGVDDPNEGYTREVKGSLVEAMLENSAPLAIGVDEWLTVAARGNTRMDRIGLTVDPSDVHTIVFRVKGSDLAAFREGRITLDEVRNRVQVKEY